MTKALFIIAPENFRDEEYFEPKKVLEEAGVEVTTASLSKEAISSINKEKVSADILLEEATADYDAVVFIGGNGSSVYFDNPKAHEIAKTAS